MGITVSFVPRMREVPAAEWDALAAGYGTPILSHGYLSLLEESGSIVPETGWAPAHFLIRRDGLLVAAAPLYMKSHSWGEYVFDFEWAEIAERLSVSYYPKLVGMVPATPAIGWRLMVRAGEDEKAMNEIFLEQAWAFCARAGLSGAHFLFCDPAWLASAEASGWHAWKHQSYLWTNPEYRDFDDYLDSFSKNMRRNVLRERASVRDSGIEVRMIRGRDSGSRLCELMAEYYERTNEKFGPWAARFLEPAFFYRLNEFLPDSYAYCAAFKASSPEPVALSFHLEGRDTLLGRFWGCAEEISGLHFEVCYYKPIEYAIEAGLRFFDPGAGSEHKVRRGFRAVPNFSLHRFRDKRLDALFRKYAPLLDAAEERRMNELNLELPFKDRSRAR